MYRNKSKTSTRARKANRRRSLLLLLAILLVVLIGSTSCKSTQTDPLEDRQEILVGMLPDLPELPEWPKLNWQFFDGMYAISEADADKILNYWENEIPNYKYELEKYQKKLDAVIASM